MGAGTGITSGYEQKACAAAELRQGRLTPGQVLRQPIAAGRHAWVQVVAGAVSLGAGGESLAMSASDGAGVSATEALEFTAGPQGAELIVFDLA